MAALYSNENFPRRVVEELRRVGNDVLTSYEAGRANQRIPDDQVLSFATGQQRAVLTLNRLDFIRLHRDTQSLVVKIWSIGYTVLFFRFRDSPASATTSESSLHEKVLILPVSTEIERWITIDSEVTQSSSIPSLISDATWRCSFLISIVYVVF